MSKRVFRSNRPGGGHMSKRVFRSNRPGYPHRVSSELENSGIRMAVGDCSVTEGLKWCLSYQTGKTVHVHAKHYKHKEDRRKAPGVCGNGSVPLSHSGNVITRIGTHTHTHTHTERNPLIWVSVICFTVWISSLYLPGEQWSEESINKFEDLTYACKWKVLMAKAESYSGSTPHLRLIDTNSEKVSREIRVHLFKTSRAA